MSDPTPLSAVVATPTQPFVLWDGTNDAAFLALFEGIPWMTASISGEGDARILNVDQTGFLTSYPLGSWVYTFLDANGVPVQAANPPIDPVTFRNTWAPANPWPTPAP